MSPPQSDETNQLLPPPEDKPASYNSTDAEANAEADEVEVTKEVPPPAPAPAAGGFEQPGKNIPTTFLEDIQNWRDGTVEGTLPQNIAHAVIIGISCAIGAFVFYISLWGFLAFMWKDLPELSGFKEHVPEYLHWLWIPMVGFTMAYGLGLSVEKCGEPGDLNYVVKCVHEEAFIHESHVIPMILASEFSITGGGSLGPEAPIVAICAGIAGLLSRKVFKTTNVNVIRKHTLMGMCSALAAFFGAPIGGSFFALEINSRFGNEYFEHASEAIFAGEICLFCFRSLAGLPIAPIWDINEIVSGVEPYEVLQGMFIGLVGAGIAGCFKWFHMKVMAWFRSRGLLDNAVATKRALTGAVPIVIIGLLVPHTMFWGEFEIQEILTMAKAEELDHIWPTTGLTGFEMDSRLTCLIVGVCKMIVISFTVAGGYRGGFIFPFFFAGSAFGQAFALVWNIKPIIASMCFAAAINVSITRTPVGTTLILSFLSGNENTQSAIFGASLVALFATAYMPFLGNQRPRMDIDKALNYAYTPASYIPQDSDHV